MNYTRPINECQSGVRYGVELPQHLGWPHLRMLAEQVEACGFDSIWVRDHLVVSPYEMEQFQSGYLVDGRRAVSGEYLGCLPTMAALAAVTSRVQIGTGVLNLPRRHPADVANEIATIDRISGGRAILQGAVGHPTRDWDPLGYDVSRGDRGRMLEEGIEIIRALWASEEPIDYHGRYYHLEQARIGSRPIQKPPPIWLGVGTTLGRAGRLADGFTLTGSMFGGRLEDFRDAVARVRDAAVTAGRDPDAIIPAARFALVVDEDSRAAKDRAEAEWGALWRQPAPWYREWAGDPDEIAARIAPYLEAGARQVTLWPIAAEDPSSTLRCLRLFAAEVIPRLRNVAGPWGGAV